MFSYPYFRSLLVLIAFVAWSGTFAVPVALGKIVPVPQIGRLSPVAPIRVAAQAQADDEAEGLDPGGSTDAAIEEEDSDEPIVDSASAAEAVAIGKKYIRFHMWDLSLIHI